MSQITLGQMTEALNRQAFRYRETEPLTERAILLITALILFDELETARTDCAELFDVIRTTPDDARMGDLRPRIVGQLNRIIAQLAEL
jgi:hypothetical protein